MRVETTIEDGVAVITINQPERKNAITLDMRTEIERAFLDGYLAEEACEPLAMVALVVHLVLRPFYDVWRIMVPNTR